MFTENFQNNVKLIGNLTDEQRGYFCVHIAKSVLHVWEKSFPENDSVRKAVEAAEQHVSGKCTNEFCNSAGNLAANSTNTFNEAAYDACWCAVYTVYDSVYKKNGYFHNAVICAALADGSVRQKLGWIDKLYSSIQENKIFLSSWKTADAINIAKCILKDNDFDGMPILADALEDSGCQDVEILNHLRYDRDLWTPVDWVLTNLLIGN